MSVFASLHNKVVLVTGASSGIGASTAVEFAKHGCRLALSGRNMANLEKTAQRCQQVGLERQKVSIVQADLTRDEDTLKVVDTVIQTFGQLDVLVNNAGTINSSSILDFDLAKYEEVMKLNLRAPLLLCKSAVPHLIKTKGNIVNVSSVWGLQPLGGILFYCLSKAAMDQLTHVLALELAPKGVRVNAVNPATINTEIHWKRFRTPDAMEAFLDVSKSLHPLGRVGEPEEVASAIVFFASDAASFTTGQLMKVDGGRLLSYPVPGDRTSKL